MQLDIGLILPLLTAGGAEQVVLDLARVFSKQSHSVTVISLGNGGNMRKRFIGARIDIKEFGFSRHFRPSYQWFKIRLDNQKSLYDYFAKKQFDVVHVHLHGPDVDVVKPARKAGIKCLVYTIHNVYPEFGGRGLHQRTKNAQRKWLYRYYDKIFAVCDPVKAWAVETGMVKGGEVEVVRNGVDFSKFDIGEVRIDIRKRLDWKINETILLNVASLTEQKNQLNLIRSVPQVLNAHSNVRLVIAGAGPLNTVLAQEIEGLQLKDKVQLLGYRVDVPDLIKAADIFVLPSHWEGLPISLLEAMGAGLPVAVSNIPIHRAMLEDGRIGFLMKDTTPEGIAACIKNAISSTHRPSLSRLAREKAVNGYSAQFMANAYLDAYVKILRKKSAGG